MTKLTGIAVKSNREPKSGRRRTLLLIALTTVAFGFIDWAMDIGMWEKQSDNFFKSDKPYGAGDFRIKGNQVISVKVSEPEIKYKPMTAVELQDPNVKAEETEPWMGNVAEILNRSLARVLFGTTTGSLEETFREPAQHTAWWLSGSGKEQILGTGWIDYKLSRVNREAPVVAIYKVFASSDGGHEWVRRAWPENRYIGAVQFLDISRGYVLGRGPSIWRTIDGGEHWQGLTTPPELVAPVEKIREFDFSVLSSDGTLWLAGYSSRGASAGQSTVYVQPWIDKPELAADESQPRPQFKIAGQSVVDMQVRGEKVWVLTRTGAPPVLGLDSDSVQHNEVHLWSDGHLQKIKEFPVEVQAGALYVLNNGTLVVDALLDQGIRPKDALYLSRDQGRTWDVENEGAGAQGVYMDGGTGERWRVVGYSLYRRLVR